jgi:hypothetical protein
MKNLCLITSVLNIPNLPLSYSKIRSIYSLEERFIQTKNTINSLKEKIPDIKIIFIECSEIPLEYEKYIKENVDYFVNYYKDQEVTNNVFSISKALGEGTLTIKGIELILKENIKFKNFFKISGRFYLNNNFDYSLFDNDFVNYSENNTRLYKLNYIQTFKFYEYLQTNEVNKKFYNCEGYENIFNEFIEVLLDKRKIEILGLEGNISVDGYKINE